MFADDITLLRKSRADAVVASIPTLAYAIGAIGGLRMAAYAGIGCAVVVCAIAARRRPLPAVAPLPGRRSTSRYASQTALSAAR